jgi:zinc transport system substrate-binding protein
VPIAGVSPDAEPSAADLARVADLVRSAGVTTIYTEPLVDPKLAATLASSTGATVATLDPVEGITSTSAGTDYLEVMTANLAAVRAGQRCP